MSTAQYGRNTHNVDVRSLDGQNPCRIPPHAPRQEPGMVEKWGKRRRLGGPFFSIVARGDKQFSLGPFKLMRNGPKEKGPRTSPPLPSTTHSSNIVLSALPLILSRPFLFVVVLHSPFCLCFCFIPGFVSLLFSDKCLDCPLPLASSEERAHRSSADSPALFSIFGCPR